MDRRNQELLPLHPPVPLPPYTPPPRATWFPSSSSSLTRPFQLSKPQHYASTTATRIISALQITTKPTLARSSASATSKPRKHSLAQVHHREEVFLYCLLAMLCAVYVIALVLMVCWRGKRSGKIDPESLGLKEKVLKRDYESLGRTVREKKKQVNATERPMSGHEQLTMSKLRPAVEVTQFDGIIGRDVEWGDVIPLDVK